MKKLQLLFLGLLASATMFMTSCDPAVELEAVISGVTITGPVAGVGIINEADKTVTINVPYGTDVSNVTGTITTTDAEATVSPNLSAGVDFSGGAVSFTVTNGDVSQTYSVSVAFGENPLRIVMVGDGALTSLHDEMQEAYNWALTTYGEKAAYVDFADLAGFDLESTKVIWWHSYDTTNGGRTTLPAAANASGAVNTFYKGGGNLLLTTHATGYLVELGRLGTDWAPTDGGSGNNSGNANPDDWGWAIEHPTFTTSFDSENANHPMWANTTKKNVTFEGVSYDAVMGIDGGTKRDAAYFWFIRNIQGVKNQFDANGDGGIDDLEGLDSNGDGTLDPATDNYQQMKEYFESQTVSKVRGSFEWDPAANGVEFFTAVEFEPTGDYQGGAITISAGAFEWLHNDGRSNAWRANQEAMVSGVFTHFGVQ